jgi:hypothetical protein
VTAGVAVAEDSTDATGVGAMNLHRNQPPHTIPASTAAAISSRSAMVPMIFSLAMVNGSP